MHVPCGMYLMVSSKPRGSPSVNVHNKSVNLYDTST